MKKAKLNKKHRITTFLSGDATTKLLKWIVSGNFYDKIDFYNQTDYGFHKNIELITLSLELIKTDSVKSAFDRSKLYCHSIVIKDSEALASFNELVKKEEN